MKLLVVSCAFVAGFLRVAGEPVIHGEKAGYALGYEKNHKKNIVGRENYPYMLHLEIIEEINEEEEKYATCGGTLLRGRVVLTAAHCIADRSGPFEVYAVAGILDLKVEQNRAQAAKMHDYLIHEDFSHKSYRGGFVVTAPNDIALIWLEEHFVYNPKVRHIELMPPNVDIEGKSGFILGWGQTEKGTFSKMLRRANLKVHSKYECEYHEKKLRYVLSNAMLCLKSEDEKSLQCKGDSGGPFIVDNKLAGIMSRSFKNEVTLESGKVVEISDTKRGAIVTNVGFYNEWINNNINRGPPKNRNKKHTKPSTNRQRIQPDAAKKTN